MLVNHNVYIDFEAITNPFARLIKLPSGIPYCYTIGLLNKKGVFETSTFIIDFHKHRGIESIWFFLKKNIIDDIKRINDEIDVNKVVFIGHNPELEKKCIKKIFPDHQVLPLIKQREVSLSKLTAKTFKNEYFINTKQLIEKLQGKKVYDSLMHRSGAIASYAGYWLYVNSLKNLRTKDSRARYFISDINEKTFTKELKKYSKDDVLKMYYLASIPERHDELVKEVLYKQELLKQINNLNLNDKLTIKEIKEKIWEI
ncbi:Uncharacterised protein [Metamycoplasma cloacale]|uniref:DUF2779 domain-containing protein n=1 Tax=Metamycoplasma cloacale TaxID=92401 RepID=A0A2Z4LNH3_9BACT|nr:hypothetical protein [Metamycoplasma cloacale]AWX42908.1 DUF2779 domain-containing protein [Metamycoplasma cloacale]VEU79268.1 Uncharacterised protein [Metamycoplasma cloacale]